MTIINVVPVEELTNGHLAIEHYELVRVYRLGTFQTEREAVEARNQFIIDNGLPHIQQ